MFVRLLIVILLLLYMASLATALPQPVFLPAPRVALLPAPAYATLPRPHFPEESSPVITIYSAPSVVYRIGSLPPVLSPATYSLPVQYSIPFSPGVSVPLGSWCPDGTCQPRR